MPAPAPSRATLPALRGHDARGAIMAIFLIVLYFMSYRYPFQIGDTDTSPTYTDTPVWLQLAKYVLLAPFLAYALVITRINRWSFSAAELLIAALSLYSVLYGGAMALTGANYGLTLIQVGFALLFAVLFAQRDVTRRSFGVFYTCLLWFFALSLVAYGVQLFLYAAFARLPALGYVGSFPRFGGIWDDPNSAAAIFVFVIPWVIVARGIGWRSAIVVGLSLVAILLSQSLTTYATIVVVFGTVVLAFYRSMPFYTRILVMLGLLVAGIALVALLGFIFLQSVDLTVSGIIRSADAILVSKVGSIVVRQNSYSFASDISFLTLLGFDPLDEFGENQWLNLLANIGLPFTLGYAVLQILTLRNLWAWSNSLPDGPSRAIVVGLFSYYLWFFLLQINIPASQIYPINIIAAVITGMGWAWRGQAATRRLGHLSSGHG